MKQFIARFESQIQGTLSGLLAAIAAIRQQVIAETKSQRPAALPARRLLTAKQAGHYLGRSEASIRQMVYRRQIAAVRFDGNVRFYAARRSGHDTGAAAVRRAFEKLLPAFFAVGKTLADVKEFAALVRLCERTNSLERLSEMHPPGWESRMQTIWGGN